MEDGETSLTLMAEKDYSLPSRRHLDYGEEFLSAIKTKP
jgi:hypothetical protein